MCLKLSEPFANDREQRVPQCQCLYWCFSAYTKTSSSYRPPASRPMRSTSYYSSMSYQQNCYDPHRSTISKSLYSLGEHPSRDFFSPMFVTHIGLNKHQALGDHRSKKKCMFLKKTFPEMARAHSSTNTTNLETHHTGEMGLSSLIYEDWRTNLQHSAILRLSLPRR